MEQKFSEDNPIQTMPNQAESKTDLIKPLETAKNKGGNFLTVLLSILLIIASLIAGLFAYQTQKLVKEITKLQNSPTPITSIGTPQTLDPMKDWKIYRDENYSYELSYPQTIYKQLRCLDEGFILKRIWNNENPILSPQPETETKIYKCDRPAPLPYSFEIVTKNEPFTMPTSTSDYNVVSENIKINNIDAIKYTSNLISEPENDRMPLVGWYSQIFFKKNGVYFLIYFGDGKDNLEIFNQILSTFKFIDAKPTTSPLQ